MQNHNRRPIISEIARTPYIPIAVGLLMGVAGFGLDVLWHDVSGIASHEEAVITTSNPGHVLIGFGGAVVLAAMAVGLSRTNRFLAVATTVVIAAAAVLFAVYGSAGHEGDGDDHHGGSASHGHFVESGGASDEKD